MRPKGASATGSGAAWNCLQRSPNGATMGRMVTGLRLVCSGLLVASLGGCGGGSQATSHLDASAVSGGSGGFAGTGGGGTGGQSATATSTAPPLCIPGASVACACVTGQTGAQTCRSAGTFAPCVCSSPTVDAGSAGGSDGSATSPPDAPAVTGGSDARSATGGVDGNSDVPIATGGTGTGVTASSAGTGGSAATSGSSGGVGASGGTAGAGGGGGGHVVDAAADQNADVPAFPDAPADANPDAVVVQGVLVPTGSMTTARYAHTATLLPSGSVLIAGGSYYVSSAASDEILASAELFDPAAGTFAATGSHMSYARENHTATLLPSGQVLIAGGFSYYGVHIEIAGSAELYDPAAGTFTPAGIFGSMTTARASHTATLLPNGMVLIAGGEDFNSYGQTTSLASAELYDPVAVTFTATGNMTTSRAAHTATLLGNGKVLIAGGYESGNILASAELYDPSTGTFTATGSMTAARLGHTATLLQSGKVLIAGGNDDNNYLASAELYDPVVVTFTAAGNMTTSRAAHTATLLPSGMVLVAGGDGGNGENPVASSELYDPTARTFSVTGNLTATVARAAHTATLLGNGKVLIAGGEGEYGVSLASAVLYDE